MKKKLANWGNYPVLESDEASFVFLKQLKGTVGGRSTMIARGNGRCYGDSALSENTISTLQYDKILSFDTENGVFECQPGIRLDQLLTVTIPKGWFLHVTPGTKLITVGGAVASNVHGKNHRNAGAFADHVAELDVLLSSNEVMTCSPDKNADLFKATCGGMGLTGVITRIKFRLKKIETSFMKQKQLKAENLDHLLQLFEQYKDHAYAVVWIDCLKKGKHFGRSILTVGDHATLTDLDAGQSRDPLQLPKAKTITFPFFLPSWVLNSFTVRAFNFLFYLKNFKREINSVISYDPFFYPLDAILHWNRMYGKKGFVQYQFALPPDAKQGLVEILNHISDKGMGSFLTVLKVMGKQEDLISFPMEGYTLALDLPLRKGLLSFLDELDKILLRYGGRIYITKDARMKPEMLKAGYPALDEFRRIVKKYNPDGKFRSLQSDRLLITPN